jgi:hypothetical protein
LAGADQYWKPFAKVYIIWKPLATSLAYAERLIIKSIILHTTTALNWLKNKLAGYMGADI